MTDPQRIVRQAMIMYVLADGAQRTLGQLDDEMRSLSADQVVEAVQAFGVMIHEVTR